jgi:hypothetical protein
LIDYDAPQMGGTMGEIFTAVAASISQAGVTLQLAGQPAPTQKAYKSLSSAVIAAGDPVLCVRISGTIVVLGRIGLAEEELAFLFIPLGSTGLVTANGQQFICRRE